MRRIVIFGNSGSGKSTMAKQLSQSEGLAHLDLDTLAWLPTTPPERRPLTQSNVDINAFVESNDSWVIEGCYSDLLELALPHSNEIVFLNLSVDKCIDNARNRPWEPHKYESKEAQDGNLEMLIEWIAQYPIREDTFSRTEHLRLYHQYDGKKRVLSQNTV